MTKGLVIVNTGDGKGKTTAALGLMLRGWGRGLRVGMLQFMKSGKAGYGEYLAADKTGIEIVSLGDGCSWESEDMNVSRLVNLRAWETAKERILSRAYDVLILDELTFLFQFGWLDVCEVVDWIRRNKPEALHLVVTGREAPQELIEFADLVTDMKEVKHPYKEHGLPAQAGIEF
jgi:cob(I)alamin adenosyltransferase